MAWLELSTGRFQATTVSLTELSDELARLSPAECLVAEDAVEDLGVGWLADQLGISLACRAPWQFGVEAGRRLPEVLRSRAPGADSARNS